MTDIPDKDLKNFVENAVPIPDAVVPVDGFSMQQTSVMRLNGYPGEPFKVTETEKWVALYNYVKERGTTVKTSKGLPAVENFSEYVSKPKVP